MPERRKSIGDLISVITVTVLFVVILSLVVFAARGYQFSQETQDHNSNVRAVMAYIINSVRDNESTEIKIENKSGTECLVIRAVEYEQNIYMIDGKLYEEYGQDLTDLHPDFANEIGETQVFEVKLLDDGMLRVTTDDGTAYVNTLGHR